MFGASAPDRRGRAGYDMTAMFTAHDGPTLPEILRAQAAEGWTAEGLTRLS